MPLPVIEGYEFGPYRIDTGERLLHRADELIPLPPKLADTLLVLVRNAGRMVDKNDLMKAVWPDTFVEEGALTRNISLLRKTLGDAGDETAYIETIPKRGYRFVAPVSTVVVEARAAAPVELRDELRKMGSPEATNGKLHGTTEPLPRSRRARAGWIALAVILLLPGIWAVARFIAGGDAGVHSPVPGMVPATALAVLPFRNVDKDASQDYFADGMTQALITRLANLRNLRVVSLSSDASGRGDTAAWTAILRNQSVNRVLTGTIFRAGGRVRIDAQLMDPRTRAVHWANSYQRSTEDILALESEVAEAIAGEIRISITAGDRKRLRQPRPTKPEALDAYLRGRSFWNRRTEDGLKRAAQYFQQAIAADPTDALAYAGLADSYSLLASLGTDGMLPTKAMPLAKAAAQKAIELDPDLADGHVSLAYVMLSYDWDLPGAAREFSRALDLDPNSATAHHWYSHYFMAAADLGKAAEQMREALQLEPLSPSINVGIGWCLYYSRQYDQAIEQFRSVVEIDPSLPMAHQALGMAYQQKGQYDQAIEEYKRAAAFSSNSPASVAALASAYAARGKQAEARQELARLEEMSRTRYVPAFYFASIHYSMGDLAKTFEWGWKAVGERCDYLMYLRVEPRVGKLAGNPEFIRGMATLHR
jgi:TolB-like protein/DNA-binding winged helix-turn-helix (wHTH) protein/Tfp pilus assembly protein PilF